VHALLTGLFSKATSAGLTAKVAAGAAALLVVGGGMAVTAQALEPTAAETTTDATTDTTTDPAVPEPTEPGQEAEPTDSASTETPEIIEPGVDGSVSVDGTDPTSGTGTTPDRVDTLDPVDTPEYTTPDPDTSPVPDAAPEKSHPENHGASVSEVAHQSFESGREHGKAVSSAARDKGGESEPVTESPEAETETSVESSSTAETDQLAAGAVSGSGKRGKG